MDEAEVSWADFALGGEGGGVRSVLEWREGLVAMLSGELMSISEVF